MKKWFSLLFLFSPFFLSAQQLAPLTVNKIMRDPSWIGSSPSDPFWSPDGQRLYFFWNPDHSESDSLYFITLKNSRPAKVKPADRRRIAAERSGSFNRSHTQMVFKEGNRLQLLDVSKNRIRTLLDQTGQIIRPRFGFQDTRIIYQQKNNLYSFNLSSGGIEQLTHFKKGNKPKEHQELSAQAAFLKADALENSAVLRRRKAKKEAHQRAEEQAPKPAFPGVIYTGDKNLRDADISPDGRFVTYHLIKKARQVKTTKIPEFVTPSGYTKIRTGRPNVGAPQSGSTFFIYDREKDSSYPVSIQRIPGIRDIPTFEKDYPTRYDSLRRKPPLRKVVMNGPLWNDPGTQAVVVVRSLDHKDRWIMLLDAAQGKLKLLDRQHDSAWIGGPGIGYTYGTGNLGWIDENTIWFQSEKTGYSHLYLQNVKTGKTRALTEGKYEVQQAELSPDKRYFYITTNKIEPGQHQFYQLRIKTGKQTRITEKMGGNEVTVSPDGAYLALLFSTAVHPWELYLQKNEAGTRALKITDKAESREYRSYPWQEPEIITFKDRDGYSVYASLYRPETPAETHPGVIFVHGAGYLQDVKRSWSYYFREHLFINLLTDQGYTVMDIDYRGSAGYGRDWRTAIYRHMGGNDLEDIVDGTKYLTTKLDVNPKRIGIWGGSYGGFMTLMALFKTDIFVCGGALRSVTDWAHYNHGYTSNILNLPQNDSLAYVRSSPIYFADGLKGHLLMCHGMVDSNVHFQDIVRLTEKLIELKKDRWQLAVYPVESHDFKEPESWRDEYTRIYRLFEQYLK